MVRWVQPMDVIKATDVMARRRNAPSPSGRRSLREHLLSGETVVVLVTLVANEIDARAEDRSVHTHLSDRRWREPQARIAASNPR